jgi:hypothetical protein
VSTLACVEGSLRSATFSALTTALPTTNSLTLFSSFLAGVEGVDAYFTPFNSPHSHHFEFVILVVITPL